MAAAPSSTLDITGSITLECWIRLDTAIATRVGELIAKTRGYGPISTGYELMLDRSRLRIVTNGSTRLIGHTMIAPLTWTHVAATYDAATGMFSTYVNGAGDSAVIFPGGAPQSNIDSLIIGTGTNGPFAGYLDEVRIWNRALPAAEIRKNMHTSVSTMGGVFSSLVLSCTFQRPYATPSPFLSLSDWSGNGNNITRSYNVTPVESRNDPALYVSPNQSLDLDGGASYAVGPGTPDVNLAGSLTAECWVYPRAPQQTAALIRMGTGGTGAGYELGLLNGRAVVKTNAAPHITSRYPVPAGRWTHIAGTYDAPSSTFTMYLDGRVDTSAISASPPGTSSDSLYVGQGYNGYIDEVRIASYAKTQAQISSFLYCSIEYLNVPPGISTNVVYSFDGSTQPAAKNGPALSLAGNAQFSAPAYFSNVPLAPLLRADNLHFPDGFYLKKSGIRLPASGTAGRTIPDSLYVPQSVLISDVKLFVALNHSADASLRISLTGPSLDSVVVENGEDLIPPNGGVITIFNDAADSSITQSLRFLEFGPTVRPYSPLRGAFTGKDAQGYWVITINDAAPGDTGRLYAWGIQINNQILVGIPPNPESLPGRFRLDQNYPNPFNPGTTIRYALPEATPVRLEVYDLLGRRIAVIVDGRQVAGEHEVNFDASGYASGVYVYRLKAGPFVSTKRMTFIR
jgi:subtilisin-like proprotein convertase family protein